MSANNSQIVAIKKSVIVTVGMVSVYSGDEVKVYVNNSPVDNSFGFTITKEQAANLADDLKKALDVHWAEELNLK